MSIRVILLSTVLISNYINVVSSSFILKGQVALSGARNSVFGAEIIYLGPKAEAIYVMERLGQQQKLDNAKKKLEGKKNEKMLEVNQANFNKLDLEAKENKFCSESMLSNICETAFTNLYFSKNKFTLDAANKPECLTQPITAKKDGKSFEYERQLVKCKTKTPAGDTNLFLEASTTYKTAGKLKYFVMNDESVKKIPIAFLMNKSEPKAPKETKGSKVQKEAKEPKVQTEMKEPKNPTSDEETNFREIPITDGTPSTTTVPITFDGAGGRATPLA